MLLANRTVAERIADASRRDITPALHLKKRTPPTFVYRIHEAPDEEKLRSLSEFVARMGYKLRSEGNAEAISQSLNQLLRDIKGRPEENMITMLTIRSMAKARYTTAHIGHYGLGFESYTHFRPHGTPPPDPLPHRGSGECRRSYYRGAV